MDYKYIEQLIERYWVGETSAQEEQILRDFFAQDDVPERLRRYEPLFAALKTDGEERLGDDFDQRLLSRLEQDTPVQARRISLSRRLRPLWQAAASVAVVVLLGTAAQHSFRRTEAPVWDYSTTSYKDTYKDPQVAYDATIDALHSVSAGIKAAGADSIVEHAADSVKG